MTRCTKLTCAIRKNITIPGQFQSMIPSTTNLLQVPHLLRVLILVLQLWLLLLFKREDFLRLIIVAVSVIDHNFLVLVILHLGTLIVLLILVLILHVELICLTKLVRSSLVSIASNILIHRDGVTAIRPLRSVSWMSQWFTLLNFLIDMSEGVRHQCWVILLLIKWCHSKPLMGEGLILPTRRSTFICGWSYNRFLSWLNGNEAVTLFEIIWILLTLNNKHLFTTTT